jgi:hypothetical protein
MQDINSLASRIDAEFVAAAEKIKKFQARRGAGRACAGCRR